MLINDFVTSGTHLGKDKTFTGLRAMVLGAVCIAPIPFAMAGGFVVGFLSNGREAQRMDYRGIEAAILIAPSSS
jgi:hypothetical protein